MDSEQQHERMSIGDRIRQARLEAGLTGAGLAERSGFTSGYVSQVERGLTTPSVGALRSICDALGIRISTLFLDSDDVNSESSASGKLVNVIRRDQRLTFIPPGTSVRHTMLCPDFKQAMEFSWSYIPAGEANAESPVTHAGQEAIVVVKGSLKVTVGDETCTLQTGDAIYFDAAIPHGWRNVTDEEVQIIWTACPPHF